MHFNGPTKQLAALASGFVTLEPGAQPHPPHRHVEEEIVIVSEGTGEFSLNGVATQVKASDMVFAESNVLHGVRNPGQNVDDILFHQDDGEERLIGVVVHGQSA